MHSIQPVPNTTYKKEGVNSPSLYGPIVTGILQEGYFLITCVFEGIDKY